MGNTPQHKPYQTLGDHLRYIREQQRQSLAEVSGAVEIDERQLERIEAGHERPAEDILLLLISYFDMQDQEAVQLWELAGYDGSAAVQPRVEEIVQDLASGQKAVVVLLGTDTRTAYSDSVTINSDAAGVTLKFGQLNSKRQAQHIAKVGMSYEQAEEVLRQLQRALLKGHYNRQPKQLPPPAADDVS